MGKEKLIPELRFPEFEGEWEEKRLDEISTWDSGGTPPKDNPDYWNGDIPWISASAMRGNEYSNSDIKITKDGLKNGSKLAIKGSLLILVRGSMLFNKIPIGIATKDLAFNQDVKSITINSNYNSKLVLYWFIAKESHFLSIVSGTGIGAGKLDLVDLKRTDIIIPSSFSEQTRIATFLTAVDKRITLLTQKKEKLEQYKKGVMQKIFNQEIRFNDEKGQEFPEWEEKRLGEVLTIGSGRDYKHLKHGDIPVFGTGGYMASVNDFLYDGETVCIGRKGTIDAPRFYQGKIWTVDTLFYTHSFKKAIPKFIFYVFQTINWKEYNEASGVPSLSKSTIEKIVIEIPSIAEQQKIATFLSALDNQIEKVDHQIVQMKQWKKGLLQKMFV